MEVLPLEVYATDSNFAVVKPPGRHYPGCVIQGDSLRILCGLAIGVAERFRDHGHEDDEFLGNIDELVQSLVGRLLHYQQVLLAHGIELPYSQPVSKADLVRLLPDFPDADGC